MNFMEQQATLLSMTPNPILLIERCGRVCYKSENRMKCDHQTPTGSCPECLYRAKTFVRRLLKLGHESVLEHAHATFHLITDRGISHEIVRHRLCSYSQESTRYCKYNDIDMIMPEISDHTKPLFDDTMRQVENTYSQMISDGMPPQYARSVLPNCLKTELIMTANFRQWRHILSLRLDDGAHPQIRSLMFQVLDILLNSEASMVFTDLCSS
ncbi:MAG: FAD-dependent thymidylate synthase [Candidatus Lokiarchaeota archaeon]|nr:FAD-dependent thymidylate synthase [Candidatus Lokiarchaeota archaeon]